MIHEIFTIGDFCFRLIAPPALMLPDNLLKFRGGSRPVYTYTVILSDDFPVPAGQVLARRKDILVLDRDGLEWRYLGVEGQPEPYACYMELSAREARILLAPARLRSAGLDPVFVSMLALERRLADRDALMLHCAFVMHGQEAILFAAPSGTGKSTQAALWTRFRNARTVNGDRALVQRIDGRWYARGWPVCGSSGICENRDVPVRAVVTLSQSDSDGAVLLTPMQAFARLYGEITVNRWNRKHLLRAMDLLEGLVTEVPVYHLACTVRRSAVEALDGALQKGR